MTATRLLDPPGAGASASPDNAIPMNKEPESPMKIRAGG
jgi:hypothetical protein